MVNFEKIASLDSINKAVSSLKKNGINVFIEENSKSAFKKILQIIPKDSDIMTMTSMTLVESGILDSIEKSGRFQLVRDKIKKLNSNIDKDEIRKIGAASSGAIGSVHAITESGEILIASATGSQLPAYAYGSEKVIFVVGAQKIVKNFDEAMKRIKNYVFPLEDKRARKEYGVGSGVNKILIINKEVNPGRIYIIIVKEKLGF